MEALTREELKVLELFRADVPRSYNIMDIKKKLGKGSYDWTFRAAKRLNSMGILRMESRGGANYCSIDLGTGLALDYLALLEQMDLPRRFPTKNIQKLISSIPASYFTFIVTGSYARGDATKKSDIDVVVIMENKEDAKKAMAVLVNEGELMVPKAHVFAFSRSEFLGMLLEKEENYGKQVFRNRLILRGAEAYYMTVREAMEHGFKG